MGGVCGMGKILKKWGIVACVAFAVFAVFTIKTYGVSENLTTQMLSDTEKNKEEIARIVLNDTGRNAVFEPQEAVNVTVYEGDLLGNGQQQVAIAVSFGLKNTVLAVYTKDATGDGYTYVGDVADFFDVRDVFFLPLTGNGTNIMIVREYANQTIGAFERSSFLKGYIWDEENNEFQNVLSIPEGIEVIWNGRWDTSQEERWQKIEERSEATQTQVENSDGPALKLVQYQAYRISDSTDTENIPDDSTFHTVKNRVVNQIYYWDNQWRRFILSEKKEPATGQTVAIIEDFSASPYILVPEYEGGYNNVLIQRQDGSVEIVSMDTLLEMDGSQAKSAVSSYV